MLTCTRKAAYMNKQKRFEMTTRKLSPGAQRQARWDRKFSPDAQRPAVEQVHPMKWNTTKPNTLQQHIKHCHNGGGHFNVWAMSDWNTVL